MKTISRQLARLGSPSKARLLARFFKTGPGEYAEGDRFWGLTVPQVRAIAREHAALSPTDTLRLLHSPMHEERLLALLILITKFEEGDAGEREKIYKLYLANTRFINNWDLVDLSAPRIVGVFLRDKPKDILFKLARAASLWERRIAIISTLAFITKGESRQALAISKILLADKHDLIHKAVGWMLREVGKRCSQEEEEVFLQQHYKNMPRTMLRYAIERFPPAQRRAYLR